MLRNRLLLLGLVLLSSGTPADSTGDGTTSFSCSGKADIGTPPPRFTAHDLRFVDRPPADGGGGRQWRGTAIEVRGPGDTLCRELGFGVEIVTGAMLNEAKAQLSLSLTSPSGEVERRYPVLQGVSAQRAAYGDQLSPDEWEIVHYYAAVRDTLHLELERPDARLRLEVGQRRFTLVRLRRQGTAELLVEQLSATR